MTKLQRLATDMLAAWDFAVSESGAAQFAWREWSKRQADLDREAGRHIETWEAREIVGNDVATETLANHEL